GGLPARGGAALRARRAFAKRKGSGRRAAALAALQRRVRRHQERHVGGTRADVPELVGARRLLARSPDQGGRLAARACTRGRRDARRHQPGGPAAGTRRHVLHARPARLAILGIADAGCVRRWLVRTAPSEDTIGTSRRQEAETLTSAREN